MGEQACVLRHRPLLDRMNRLADLAVEQEQISVGAHRPQRLNRLAADLRS
jgi:hypothetical protein